MKTYFDYTQQELDALYAAMSPVAQDIVFGNRIDDIVLASRNIVPTPIDKLEDLQMLLLETLLGIVPVNMFSNELATRLALGSEQNNTLVAYLDKEIFSAIRDESIDIYEAENDMNSTLPGVGAIYDETMSGMTTDPYREDLGSMSRGPLITEDKLHLVDELFAPHHPKVRELTPADGSVRVQPADSPHVPHLFGMGAHAAEKSPVIITKASLLAAENGSAPAQAQPDTPKPTSVNIPVRTISDTQIKEVEPVPVVEESKSSIESNPVRNKIQIVVTKGSTPGKIQLTVSKVPNSVSAVTDIAKESKTIPEPMSSTQQVIATTVPTTYRVDPYKEQI